MDLKERDLNTIKYRVINIARKFGVVQDNWDDLIQDVILYILENMDTFDSNRSWNAWLYTVSKNATLRFVMQYKVPVAIPKSTWQRQTADMKKSYTNTNNPENWSAMTNAFREGFDPTISRIFLERTGVRTEYKDEAGYVFRDSIATSSPYKL
jgi:DNA-directed RNA polymerase specialized sigma24 family protein